MFRWLTYFLCIENVCMWCYNKCTKFRLGIGFYNTSYLSERHMLLVLVATWNEALLITGNKITMHLHGKKHLMTLFNYIKIIMLCLQLMKCLFKMKFCWNIFAIFQQKPETTLHTIYRKISHFVFLLLYI